MPRYARQRDNFRCGPVAILNALKWAGSNATYDLIPKLSAEANCNDSSGTTEKSLGKVLKKRGEKFFTALKDSSPSLKKIEMCLRDGGAVLLNFKYSLHNKRFCHSTLLVDISQTGQTVYGINYFHNETFSAVPRKRLRNDCRPRKFKNVVSSPVVWYLYLKNN